MIFADIFTSYAKVLGDVWLSLCMLLPGGSLLSTPTQHGWYRWILPTLMRYVFFFFFWFSVPPLFSEYIAHDDLVFHTSCAFDSA